MTTRDWNRHYAAGDLSWDTGVPDAHLVWGRVEGTVMSNANAQILEQAEDTTV